MVGVRSIAAEASGAAAVAPTEPRDLSIEFIGDSITCGYGVEATGTDAPFQTTTENFMKSYAYLTAQELGAEYGTVCYSGYGIVSGWSGDGTRKDDMLVPPLYDVVAEDLEVPWDHAGHPYDVVVINLGTNDFTYTGTDESRMQEFATAYVEFLSAVREVNPESYIVCTMGTMGCQELYAYVEQAVAEFSDDYGDARVSCYLSDEIDYEADGVGAKQHPNAISQQKSAHTLAEVIESLL